MLFGPRNTPQINEKRRMDESRASSRVAGHALATHATAGEPAAANARFAAPLPVDANGAPAAARRDARSPRSQRAQARILVADDNRDAASSLATLLSLEGHDVRVANDGEQAVAEAERFRPDVALLDIGMPRKNGYEVAREIRVREWGREMLLVAVTGWGQSEDKRRAKEAGFDHHFTKPLDLDALSAFLANALARRS